MTLFKSLIVCVLQKSSKHCRLSAVFGGTYALNQSLNGIVLDHKHNFKALIIDRQRIKAENVVIGVDKAPKEFVASLGCKKFISRGIFITDRYAEAF